MCTRSDGAPVVLNNGLVGGPLFTTEWQSRYAAIVERSMVATIKVYIPGPATYDPDTDTWSASETVLYGVGTPIGSDGRARVQPLRTARRADVPGDDTSVQTFLFSIPVRYNNIDFRPGHQVRVTASPLNTLLLKYEFVVSEVPDSSNPIERTFYCTMNQEVVV